MSDSQAPRPDAPWWRRTNLVVALLVLASVCLVATVALRLAADRSVAAAEPTPGATLADVLADVGSGGVTSAELDEQHQTLTVTHEDRSTATVTFPLAYSGELTGELVDAGVPLTVHAAAPRAGGASPSGDGGLLHDAAVGTGLLAVVLALTAGLVHVRRRVTGGSARMTSEVTVPTTRFADVAGADEAVTDLRELVEFLADPARFARLGATVPKGALLCGPPGTGKTLLARAVAGEAGVPFFSASGSDFVEMYVGVGAKRVRELFTAAGKHEKAIIFLDEIDAVARKRAGNSDQGGTAGNGSEHEGTLLALLTELDGFADRGTVVVLAATNRPDVLDPALTRPGRLDRKIEVPNPDRRGREGILAVHARRTRLASDVDLTSVARRTPGFSGAQLGAIVNEAALEAVRRDLDLVDSACLDHAVATVAMGRARTSALVSERDRAITAWHEAGHTLAALLLPDADDPVQVTIVPRGPAGGVTWMAGNDDVFLGRRKALSQLVVSLAGRAGEEALLDGEYTQGAAGDLQSATQTALQLTTQLGMSRLGYMVRSDGVLQAGGMKDVNEVVEELLTEAHAKATALVTAHRALLDAVAEALLDVETLTLAQVRAIADGLGVAVPTTLPLVDATPWTGEARRPSPTPSALPGRTVRVPAQRRPVDEQLPQPVAAATPVRAVTGARGLLRAVGTVAGAAARETAVRVQDRTARRRSAS